MLGCSGFGGRQVRRSIHAACVLLLITSAVLCALTVGCGVNAGKNYLAEIDQIIFEVNAKANELKESWNLSLAEQGNMSKTLTDFRKLLGVAQGKLDSSHPPQQFLYLDEKVRRVVDKGRELADLYSPFADYFEAAAPLAKQMADTVSSVQGSQPQQDAPSALLGYTEQVRAADARARSITPPQVFTGMHIEFEHFIESMLAAFEGASNYYGSSSQRDDYSNTRSYDEEGAYGTASNSRQGSSQPRTTVIRLREIAQTWSDYNTQLSAIIGTVQDVMGIKIKNADLENLVVQAVTEIHRLEKQYK
jgi:hypothetical protein